MTAYDRLAEKSGYKKDWESLKEDWYFTGFVYDIGDLISECELCLHPLRYEWEIRNINNFNTMKVGCHCIDKFGIQSRTADGKIVTKECAKKNYYIYALISLNKKLSDFDPSYMNNRIIKNKPVSVKAIKYNLYKIADYAEKYGLTIDEERAVESFFKRHLE